MSSPDLFPPLDLRSSRRRRLQRRVAGALVIVLLLLAIPVLWLWMQLLGSRPQLDGEIRVRGLDHPVAITRDALGIPSILSVDRLDAALALGFLHGQDRFFQMDLMRRVAAGELAALLGSALIDQDKEVRLHRFRSVARRMLAQTSRLQLIEAYSRGVNAGLAQVRSAPFEYRLLRTPPEPWLPEDIFLVVLSMYLELQGSHSNIEISLGLIHDRLPQELAAFLATPGTKWDAPLLGSVIQTPAIPAADVVNLRQTRNALPAADRLEWQLQAARRHPLDRRAALRRQAETATGSNSWAVAGSLTTSGHALLAGDMHLGLAVPNIWYRATLSFRDSTSVRGRRQLHGFTLPGTPLLVVGSNGDVAWSFTSANADQSDVVVLESTSDGFYATPDGPRALLSHQEIIQVKGATAETLQVLESIWGPVVGRDAAGRLLAQSWVAHDPAGVNFGLLALEMARDVDEGVHAVTRSAIPAVNCILADRGGRIAWTVAGILPKRRGMDGRLPTSWADGTRGWDGFLAPVDVPRIVDPVGGRLWSANNRHVGGKALAKLGDGNYVLGARATQIRDALLRTQQATPADFLALQLDDRALLLERWQRLLLETLSSAVAQNDPDLVAMRSYVEDWGGRAAIGSVGYRIVRNFRYTVTDGLLEPLLAPCLAADPTFRTWHLRNREGPTWKIIQERPTHLLPSPHNRWEDFFLAMTRSTRESLESIGPLADRTWGDRNTTRIQHPLSLGVPLLGKWLDMPSEPIPGDGHMPRVQSPTFAASQRLVVAPGLEGDALAHMPVGQSGHPLSPYYRNSHAAWMQGSPTALLPGPVEHTLQLLPD